MMKLSTRGEYGPGQCLIWPSIGEGPIALRSIAERQDISENYLEQLIASLRGRLWTVFGGTGRVYSARAQCIRIGDIYVLEGPIAPRAMS